MAKNSIRMLAAVMWFTLAAGASAQSASSTPSGSPALSAVGLSDYVIGVGDRLGIMFWREQDKALSSEVVVRPDGKISVPMLNDITAAGLRPEQLATTVQAAAAKYIRDAQATVIVREIHSRRVFVIGEVSKPGPVDVGAEMTVLQALAEAGGLLEHANKTDVAIVRKENGSERRFKFNYKEVVRGKNVSQNIRLVPGDTILVR